MANIGRNDPCPCGSGKKYKRCCMKKVSAAPEHVRPQLPPPKKPKPQPTPPEITVLPGGGLVIWDDDDLDELSNRANDLTRAGRLDEAEAACRELQERYPDLIDSLDRPAALYEARGDYAKAAEYYRKAAEFARTHEGFDPEVAEYHDEQAERLEARLTTAPDPPKPGTEPAP